MRRLLCLLTCLVVILVACGNSGDDNATSTTTDALASTTTGPPPTVPPVSTCADVAPATTVPGSDTTVPTTATTLPTTTLPIPTTTIAGVGPQVGDRVAAKPVVEIPDPLPGELCIVDLVVGDGEPVPAGATVTVEYVGVLPDGTEFDSSWNREAPISFPLDGVIPGWTQGIPGMNVGGRRLLVIPGALAYGDQGSPDGSIGPNQTLVFVVDMIDFDTTPPTSAPVVAGQPG